MKVRFHDFRTITRSVTLPTPVDTGADVARAAKELLAAVDPSPGVRLLGVGVTNLGADAGRAAQPRRRPRRRRRRRRRAWGRRPTDAVDAIRDRFGDDAIAPGGARRPGPQAARRAAVGADRPGAPSERLSAGSRGSALPEAVPCGSLRGRRPARRKGTGPVPLSEDEQRILREIEQQFYDTDPDFAREVGTTSLYRHGLRRLKLAGAAVRRRPRRPRVDARARQRPRSPSASAPVPMFAAALLFEANLRKLGRAGLQQVTATRPGGRPPRRPRQRRSPGPWPPPPRRHRRGVARSAPADRSALDGGGLDVDARARPGAAAPA